VGLTAIHTWILSLLMDDGSVARVAAAVRRAMADKQVRQVELAKQTGIKQSTLSRRLRAEDEFTVSELERVAEALQVSTSALLDNQAHRAAS
jgi:transcriptional regulator with XRE-family HTH domain